MSKTLIVSTSTLEDEIRGARIRLDTLNKYKNEGAGFIYVPTITKKGKLIISGTTIEYFPLKLKDLFIFFYLFFKGLPLTNIIYRRSSIKNNLYKFDTVIFHLVRTIQLPITSNNFIVDVCESLAENFYLRSRSMKKFSVKKALFRFEAQRLRKYENKVIQNPKLLKLFITSNDPLVPKSKNFKIVPNLPTYERKNNTREIVLNRKKTIFIGHVDYEPNLDSIIQTAKYLLEIDSEIEFHIIGRYNKTSRETLHSYKNIKLHGFVDDFESLISDALCGFSIIKNGTGMQNKVLDYFAYSLPAIISPEVQKGLPASSPAIVCNSMAELKDSITILGDVAKRNEIISLGHEYLCNIHKAFKELK